MVESIDDRVNAGVEVPDPQDVQVQAVRCLNLLNMSSLLNLNKKSNFAKHKYVHNLPLTNLPRCYHTNKETH
jgi:hypothetical protein